MSKIVTRKSCIDVIPALRIIWKTVFGNIGVDSFFRHVFDTELCVVAIIDEAIAASGYIIPAGHIITGSESLKCAMIYSVATIPEHRGIGLGTAVVRSLIELTDELGYHAVVLCPSDDDLFGYYSLRTGMHDWFYTNEQVFTQALLDNNAFPTASNSPPLPVEVSVNDYNSLRGELLKGTVHIKHNSLILEFQSLLCSELGGGLYKVGDSCAIVERQDNDTVWVKELLTPGGLIDDLTSSPVASDVVAAIMKMFPAREYRVRFPSRAGKGRRFGMIVFNDGVQRDMFEKGTAPWFGMAFD